MHALGRQFVHRVPAVLAQVAWIALVDIRGLPVRDHQQQLVAFAAQAEMPAGSVLFWAGGTLHGAGANVTDDEWRYGMILTYNLSFLRQEENQHVSMPLADALALPADVQARLGFAQDNGDGLGFYDPRPVLQR